MGLTDYRGFLQESRKTEDKFATFIDWYEVENLPCKIDDLIKNVESADISFFILILPTKYSTLADISFFILILPTKYSTLTNVTLHILISLVYNIHYTLDNTPCTCTLVRFVHYIATGPKTHSNQYPKQYPKPCPNPNTIIAYALIYCSGNIMREPFG